MHLVRCTEEVYMNYVCKKVGKEGHLNSNWGKGSIYELQS